MSSRGRSIAVWTLVCCWTLAQQDPSRAGVLDGLYDADEASFSLSGSLRQIGLYTRGTNVKEFETAFVAGGADCLGANALETCSAFDLVGKRDVFQGSTRLWVDASLRLRDELSLVVVYENEAAYGVLDTLEREAAKSLASDSFLRAEGVLSSDRHYEWRHELYRGYVLLETQGFEISLGRQRVAWGVGRLWTPIDRFSALDPLSLQPDDTPGIDGIDARFNFNGFNYIQVVYAPGGGLDEARYAARLHGVLNDADVSIMAGLFEKAPTVGVDFARNLGDAAVRFEAVYTSPRHKTEGLVFETPQDYWQIVASFDINLNYGTGVYFLAEYLYNGNALGSDSAASVIGGDLSQLGTSRVITLEAHQLGLQFGYDLTPELRFDLVTLIDPNRGSAAFFPNLGYSPLDNLEATLGVQLFAGPEHSEFGGSEFVVYLLTDWYF